MKSLYPVTRILHSHHIIQNLWCPIGMKMNENEYEKPRFSFTSHNCHDWFQRYGYAVKDDICNDFNQQETSDGSQVSGQYSVLLPDGRVLTVTYTVTPESGYVVSNILEMKIKMMKMIFTLLQAEVKYSEGPICETPPSYQQPVPSYQIDGWFKLPNVPHKLNKQFNVISM